MRYLLCVVLVVSFLGCGPGNPLGRQAVSGTVTLDGKPLAAGTIMFEPRGSEGALAGAPIADGKFTIAGQRGLPPGTYLVRISAPTPRGGVAAEGMPGDSASASRDAPELIPAAWNTNSQHTVTVEKGANQFDFAIETK